ncbi:hypothetical protein A9Q84_05550 [Halobacteriovorax marinus]|uniref:Hsp70 family protein n=1 Tax=Halobacteriovorax marinus TaxID=97084 RepID=A0A1Y5FBK1_9BACT|nr:hypothetical protein A9Q84_05550 [Halobacteriovorax marinus]
MSNELIYALDFGTSNTLLGAATPLGSIDSIPLDFQNKNPHVMRSLIYTPREYEWLYGNECYEKYLTNEGEGRFFRSFKSLLSRETFEGTTIHDKRVSVEEIVARFIREVRNRANSFYQRDIDSVVVGRPVMFGDTKRSDEVALARFEKALKMAGFKNVEFCYEPVAAAKSYNETYESKKKVLIADLGGGTSDFSVINLQNKRFSSEDILSVAGINVAGDSFDFNLMRDYVMPNLGSRVKYKRPASNMENGLSKKLLDQLCSPAIFSLINDTHIQNYVEDALDFVEEESDIKKLENLERLFDHKLGYDLMRNVENSKIYLSSHSETKLSYKRWGMNIESLIQKSDYFESCSEVSESIDKTLNEALKLANCRTSDIDFVLCTGGTVQHPLIAKKLTEKFGVEKIRWSNIHGAVTKGLAARAFELIQK